MRGSVDTDVYSQYTLVIPSMCNGIVGWDHVSVDLHV